MNPLDLGLAAMGALAAAVGRQFGSGRGTWLVVIGLVLMSAIPTYLIGSSPRPTDLTFEDVHVGRIPAMTSWVRLEGELRLFPGSDSLYELHDTADDALYVLVITDAPLEIGHTVLTGRLSPRTATTGNIGSLDPDIPPVPKRNEPFALILLPAAIGGMIVVGRRLGYPVVRRERRSPTHAPRLAPGERLDGRWCGRIAGEMVAVATTRPASIGVTAGPDVHELSIRDDEADRAVRVRGSLAVPLVKVCRINGCESGVLIRAQNADVVLVFERREDRDRLVATLGQGQRIAG
jgi:hypothetical protein